jgi:hypothetical protein
MSLHRSFLGSRGRGDLASDQKPRWRPSASKGKRRIDAPSSPARIVKQSTNQRATRSKEATTVEKWWMRGATFGPCNCDWGCPCNFDAPPTYGHCDGVYVWSVREGRYGSVSLNELAFAWAAHSPGPLHMGDVTGVVIIDERATDAQRAALETLWSGASGLPFDIFASVTSTWLDTVFAPFEIELDGINTRASIADGQIFEVRQARVRNPVTGDEEELYLEKPTGFTSTRSELGTSHLATFALNGFGLDDMSGKYAEYAEFEYAGP